MRTDVAVVGAARLDVGLGGADPGLMVQAVVSAALESCEVPRERLGFVCSGSCDYSFGQPFAFVSALDGVGAWPPMAESHVEMDGAWALYEAWVKLLTGDIDAALVYAFGCTSRGQREAVYSLQLDPYFLAPLGADAAALAGLQARALVDAGRYSEADFARVAARGTDLDPAALLERPYTASPLRAHDRAPGGDGACAVILARGELARSATARPAWIQGLAHAIDPQSPGARDLTRAPSLARAAAAAGVDPGALDLAELHAPFSSQAFIIRDELALPHAVAINPSGRVLSTDVPMVTGLNRVVEAARRVLAGDADRALAHATSGPCLQQNLVATLAGE
jgi:acetyl-CoA acetyltransferase